MLNTWVPLRARLRRERTTARWFSAAMVAVREASVPSMSSQVALVSARPAGSLEAVPSKM
jgi:hypothetical protein